MRILHPEPKPPIHTGMKNFLAHNSISILNSHYNLSFLLISKKNHQPWVVCILRYVAT